MRVCVGYRDAIRHCENYPIEKSRARSCTFFEPPTAAWRNRYTARFGSNDPVDVVVSRSRDLRNMDGIRFHLASPAVFRETKDLYGDLFDDVRVATPPLAFIQLASSLSLIELICLGFELCGSYSLAEVGEGFFPRSPLSSANSLSKVAKRVSGMHGVAKARIAARYVLDGAASPAETVVACLLTLPLRLGGFGLSGARLNHRIDFADGSFCVCDMYWPQGRIAIEYDSDMYHSGPERIARDSRRRARLNEAGVQVISLTNAQVHNADDMKRVAVIVAKALGKRVKVGSFDMTPERRGLRRGLLVDGATSAWLHS